MDETARFRTLLTWRNMWRRFCWMCQLGTFLELTERTRQVYNLITLEDIRAVPYQRMGMHITYEHNGTGYLQAVLRVVHEGLCRALGSTIVPICKDVGRLYVDGISFSYGGPSGYTWRHNVHAGDQLEGYIARFRAAELASRPARHRRAP